MSAPARAEGGWPHGRVLLDANVLVSVILSDMLLSLSEAGLFEVRWSSPILSEAMRAVRRMMPAHADGAARRLEAADAYFADARVEGWETRMDGISLPDADDRHVLAAAVEGGCSAIVTLNTRDFPEAATAPFGVAAVHPDEFLVRLYRGRGADVRLVVNAMLSGKSNPEVSLAQEVRYLRASQAPRFASLLEETA